MADAVRTIVVRTVPRLRAMDSRADLDLGGLRVLQAAPGGDSASLEVPADWDDAQVAAWVAAQQRAGLLATVGPEGQPSGYREALPAVWRPLAIESIGPMELRPFAVEDFERTFAVHGITLASVKAGNWGAGVAVGVLDTWVDAGHEWLSGHVVWSGGSPRDSQGHGTHVAGTIRAIASDAAILAYNGLPNGQGSEQNLQAGFVAITDQALRMGYRKLVINCSFGAPGMRSAQIGDGCRYAQARGAIVVAAAGNTRGASIGSPALEADNIILALEQDGRTPTDFTSGLDWRSPHRFGCVGRDVYSSFPGNRYGLSSGTSMSAPHSSGMAALYLAPLDYNALEVA